MAASNALKLIFETEGEGKLKQALGDILKQMAAVSAESLTLSETYKNNGHQVEYLEAKQRNLREKLELAKQAVLACNDAYGKNSEQTKNAQQAVKDLEKEIRSNNKELATAKQQHEYLERAVVQLTAKKKDLQAQINSAKALLTHETTELANNTKKYGENSKEVKANKDNIETLKKTISQLEGEYSSVSVELNETKTKLNETEKEQRDLNAAQESGVTSTKRSAEGYTMLRNVLANLATQVIRVAVREMMDLAKSVVETGAEFESSLSQIAATAGYTVEDLADSTSDASQELEKYKEKAKEIGKTTKYSMTEAAEGMNILKLAGLDTADTLEVIDDVLSLAAAGNFDTEAAAAGLTASVLGFRDSWSNSQYYADLVAEGASLAKTDVDELNKALGDGAALFDAFDQNAETATLAILRLAQGNITSSNAVTALKTALRKTYTEGEDLAAIGVSAFDEATGKARNFNDVISDINNALAGLSAQERIEWIDDFYGARGEIAYADLVAVSDEQLKEWAYALEHASDGMGSAYEKSKTQLDNLQGDWTIFKNTLDVYKSEVYDGMEDGLREAIASMSETLKDVDWKDVGKDVGEIVNGLVDVLKWIIENGDTAKAVLEGVLGAAVMTKMGTGISKVVGTVSKLGPAFNSAGEGAAAASIPMGGLVGIAAAIAAAIIAITEAIILNKLEASEAAAAYLEDAYAASEFYDSVEKLRKESGDLYEATSKGTSAMNSQVAEIKANAREAEILTGRIEDLADTQNRSAADTEKMKALISELNAIMPELNVGYDELSDAITINGEATEDWTEKVYDNIAALREQAIAAAYKDTWSESIKRQAEAETEMIRIQGEIDKALATANEYSENKYGRTISGLSMHDVNADTTMAGYIQTLVHLKEAYDEAAGAMRKATDTMEICEEKMGWMADEQSAAVRRMADEYDHVYNTELSELFEEATEKAKHLGVDIPEYIVQGLTDGTLDVEAATKEMRDIIDLSDAVDDAREKGLTIPEELVNGINSGEYSISEALNAVNSLVSAAGAKMTAEMNVIGAAGAVGMGRGFESQRQRVASSAAYTAEGALGALYAANQDFFAAGIQHGRQYEQGYKTALNQHSPSRKMAENAKYTVMGALEAFRSMDGSMYDAGAEMAGAFDDGFSGIGGISGLLTGLRESMANVMHVQYDSTINHTGVIRVEGINDSGQLVDVVNIVIDQMRAEARA